MGHARLEEVRRQRDLERAGWTVIRVRWSDLRVIDEVVAHIGPGGSIPDAPVGGAGPANFAAWRRAGAAGFGIGTAIYRPGQPVGQTADAAARVVAAHDAAAGTRA